MNDNSKYYSKQTLWSLFLTCAFPIHIWALVLFFNDYDWIAKRSGAWDAIGVGSYALLFALAESALTFLAAAALGFLISRKWEQRRRLALLSALVFILSLWGIFAQLYFLLNMTIPLPASWIGLTLRSGRPVLSLYLLAGVVVGLTVLPLVYLILKSERTVRFILGAVERISLLTAFYLFFDLIGLIVVVIRNLS